MPEPIAGETREDFVDRCIPEVLDDGTAKDGEQAAAVCNSIFEESDVEVDVHPHEETPQLRTKVATDWWSSPFLRIPHHGPQVDRDRGILRNVAVVTVGEAKGHGVQLDQLFIEDVVSLGNAAPRGIKVRFTHPNASGSALGTYLGRAKNFRSDGSVARCDIQLSDVAKKSPKGDLFEYVLSMADANPDMFGASIVFRRGEMKDTDVEDTTLADLPIATIEKLTAVDLVDDPAANEDGLFSTGWTSDQMAARATTFLDSNPEVYGAILSFLAANPDIWDIIQEKPQSLTPFLVRYDEYCNYQEPKQEEGAMPDPNTPKGEDSELSTPPVSDTPVAPQDPPVDRNKELIDINEKFGADVLSKAVAENLSLEQAQVVYYQSLEEQVKDLNDKVEELSVAPAEGEEDPVGFGSAEEAEEALKTEAHKAKVDEFSQKTGSEGTGAFAAGLKLA